MEVVDKSEIFWSHNGAVNEEYSCFVCDVQGVVRNKIMFSDWRMLKECEWIANHGPRRLFLCGHSSEGLVGTSTEKGSYLGRTVSTGNGVVCECEGYVEAGAK